MSPARAALLPCNQVRGTSLDRSAILAGAALSATLPCHSARSQPPAPPAMLPKGCGHVAGAARSAGPLPGAALWRAAAAARPGRAARRQLRCAAMDRQQQMDRAPAADAEQQQGAVEPHLECFGTGMEVECRLVQDGPPHVPVPGEDPAVVSRSSAAAAAAAQQQPEEQDKGEGRGRVAIVCTCLLSCPCHWRPAATQPPNVAALQPSSAACRLSLPLPARPLMPTTHIQLPPPHCVQARWRQFWMPLCWFRPSSSGAPPWWP